MLSEALLDVRTHFSALHSAAVIAHKGHPKVTDWLTKWGLTVGTLQERKHLQEGGYALKYAWERTRPDQEPGALVTLWTEDLSVDDDGTWFAHDWLLPELHVNLQARGRLQVERTKERARILKAAFEAGRPFDGLLLENRLTRKKLYEQSSPQSEILNSVQDDVKWWVVRWDEEKSSALLVRSAEHPKDWLPTHERKKRASSFRLAFPDQAHRDAVEKAAVNAVKDAWPRHDILSREVDNCGYDLELRSRSTGNVEYMFEVKGTANDTPHFYITQNEASCAERESKWRLVMVTSALNAAVVHEPLRWDEVKRDFELEPMAWHAKQRR